MVANYLGKTYMVANVSGCRWPRLTFRCLFEGLIMRLLEVIQTLCGRRRFGGTLVPWKASTTVCRNPGLGMQSLLWYCPFGVGSSGSCYSVASYYIPEETYGFYDELMLLYVFWTFEVLFGGAICRYRALTVHVNRMRVKVSLCVKYSNVLLTLRKLLGVCVW